LILLDLIMPIMDGLAFLHAVRLEPRWQNIPVAVITAKDLSAAEIQQLQQQTLEVISKSEAFASDLKRLLQRLLQRVELARAAGQAVKASGL
jgi:CheY-like chemotaxis protein